MLVFYLLQKQGKNNLNVGIISICTCNKTRNIHRIIESYNFFELEGTLTDHLVQFPSNEQGHPQRSETSETCPAWSWTSLHWHSVFLPQVYARLQSESPALDSYLGGICHQDRQPSPHVALSSRHHPWETCSQIFFRKASQRGFCERMGDIWWSKRMMGEQ